VGGNDPGWPGMIGSRKGGWCVVVGGRGHRGTVEPMATVVVIVRILSSGVQPVGWRCRS